MDKLRKIFIKPGKKMAVNVCIVLALVGVYIYSVSSEGFSWPYFWGCIALILATGIILNLNVRLKRASGLLFMLLLPPASFYLLEAYSHNAFDMGGVLQLLNIAFFYIFFLLLFMLTGKANTAGIIGCLFPMIVGIINYYTVIFRGSPVLPWDLLSLGTAMSVSDNYEFAVEYRMLVPALGFVLLTAIAGKISIRLPKLWERKDAAKPLTVGAFRGVILRLVGAAACICAVFGIFLSLQVSGVKSFLGMDETLFLPKTLYATNGFAVSFIYNMQYIEIDKPEGYSTELVARIMEPYLEGDSQIAGAATDGAASPDGERPENVQIQGSERKTVGAGGKNSSESAADGGESAAESLDSAENTADGESAAVPGADAGEDVEAADEAPGAGEDAGAADEAPDVNANESAAAEGDASGTEAADADERQPNIIVIMNEAFSDLSVLGDFETNADYMPFFRSLKEDTVRGNLFVSVKGGNTANTEFEFLTGDTMAFLPQGSVAYQQYIHEEKPTLTSWLESLGYATAALHPFNASGWDRDEVYPYFGFDTILFYPDFTHRELLRTYVSDRSSFAQLIDVFEAKEEGQPLFAFEVTMQNHSGYYNDYDNFTPEIELGFEPENAREKHYTEQYLSLVKKSDEAFEELIDYFKNVDENTIVVMFGDHQPTDIIAKPILEYNGKTGDESLETQQERYIVPFVIWANYDIEEQEIERLSPNFLSSLILDVAGLPKSGYQQYLSDLSQTLPVITANIYIDADGNYYNSSDNPYQEDIEAYQALQYYHLFDKDKSLAEFYGVTPEAEE